ncbi:MAG: DUF106 domain-containing protein [Promethearchaeota archaeon]|nr:MAG: DUF106 domain-containing protein [Candidatus Lokiarchaeota archaeon]
MSDIMIILIILLISLGITLLGLLFNHLFGLRGDKMREFREKAKNLQERLKNAQAIGDPQMMREIQNESMEMTKEMMKNQFIPLCGRCILFLGIFFVLSIIFSNYSSGLLIPVEIPLLGSGWFFWYFIFSMGFSLLFWGIRKAYRKITGKEKPGSVTKEMMDMLSPSSQRTSREPIQYGNKLNSSQSSNEDVNDDWKSKLND